MADGTWSKSKTHVSAVPDSKCVHSCVPKPFLRSHLSRAISESRRLMMEELRDLPSRSIAFSSWAKPSHQRSSKV